MRRARGPASAACAYLHDAYRASLAHPRVRRLLTPRSGAAPQARDCGFADHATAAQLETATLLRRADLVTEHMRRVRLALALRAPAPSLVRSSRQDALGFAALPHAVALQIFALLPVDQRARAAVICRAWRAIVAEPSLWTRLDLSPSSGVQQPVTDAVLRGAAALARGALEVLVLDACDTSPEAELEVVAANAGSLRELSCCSDDESVLSAGCVEELVLAASQLRNFHAHTAASVADAIRMLRNEAPFGALRLRVLYVVHAETDAINEATVLELAAAMPGHASLYKLILNDVPLNTRAVLDAVTAAALACRLRGLVLRRCNLSPGWIPALARMIRGGALTNLHIDNDGGLQLLDEPDAVQLADAIAASCTLTRFVLEDVHFWADAAAAAAVVHALTGHPSVRVIALDCNEVPDAAAAGAALGVLVAANAPALQELNVRGCTLGDEGLGPLFDALPHNTHLRQLDCSNNEMSDEFARFRFLPAVRANTSLRKLIASELWDNEEDGDAPPEVLEAEELVAARAAVKAA